MDIPAEWTFRSTAVAAGFDEHVREQLPWYDLATGLVVQAGRHFIPAGGRVLDVGASTGNIGRALQPTLVARGATLLAVEASAEMAARYHGPGEVRVVDVLDLDRADLEVDLVVAFLTLMFVPVRYRRRLVDRLCSAVRPGGAVVIFDKVEARPGYVGTMLGRLALEAKLSAGARPADVLAKELSLAGVQRPLSAVELGGFEEVFRFGDFGGWIWTADAHHPAPPW